MLRLKRKHNALWTTLTLMTPWGSPTWVVYVHDAPSAPHKDLELARSSSRLMALIRAQRVPFTQVDG
jgi:hypothetical protein